MDNYYLSPKIKRVVATNILAMVILINHASMKTVYILYT